MIYTEMAKAEQDLKLFSSMHMNEDKPLYLVCTPSGMVILREPTAVNLISAIALNGVLFEPRN